MYPINWLQSPGRVATLVSESKAGIVPLVQYYIPQEEQLYTTIASYKWALTDKIFVYDYKVCPRISRQPRKLSQPRTNGRIFRDKSLFSRAGMASFWARTLFKQKIIKGKLGRAYGAWDAQFKQMFKKRCKNPVAIQLNVD